MRTRIPILSIICGVLTVVAAGFLGNWFRHTDVRLAGVICGIIFAGGFVFFGWLVRWR
jgi:hypothetical protein